MSRSRLVLVRHGETAWSRKGRHTGRTDVPLVAEGRRQAAALRELLESFRPDRVLTSPLARARATCRLSGFGEGAEVETALAEWDYGDVEGLTTAEARARWPGWTIWTGPVPRGESVAEVGRRADRVVDRARGAGGTTLCFSHGHLLRVLAARWVGSDPTAGRHWALGPGSVSVLDWEHEAPVIESWNRAP